MYDQFIEIWEEKEMYGSFVDDWKTPDEYISKKAAVKAIASTMPSMSTLYGSRENDHLILAAQEMCVDAIKAVRDVRPANVIRAKRAHWIVKETEEKPSAPTTRASILDEAKRCVCGQREQDYGKAEDNFRLIASLWEPYIRQRCVSDGADVYIMPEDVAMLMALLKIARICSGTGTQDSFVDLAGYAACGGEISGGICDARNRTDNA